MKIIVFGANGPTGRLLTTQALYAGHAVTAFMRSPEQFPLTHPGLRIAGGDVRDHDRVSSALRRQDVVLSTLGVPFTRDQVDTYSTGGQNIVAAMRTHGVRRLACVTSSVLESGATTGSWFVDTVVQPLVMKTFGRTVYADMRRLEEALLRETDLQWTVLRPSGLCETPHVTDYRLGEGHLPHLFTARRDLADALLRQATDDTWAQRRAAVASTQVSPSIVRLLFKEGRGEKAA